MAGGVAVDIDAGILDQMIECCEQVFARATGWAMA